MSPLTVAVPTGRLLHDAVRLLERAGLHARGLGDDRRLLVDLEGGARVLLARPTDLLTYVEQGAADVGIVGRDMLLEQGRDVYELLDLGFGACRAVVALPEERAEQLWRPGHALRVATKYPRLTARYFEQVARPAEIVVLYGSVELAPLVGLADGIVDLVMTGRTLRENRLREVAEIAQSTARLVVNRSSLSRSRRTAELVATVRALCVQEAGRAGG
ncbi:MAG: ATP phosphoribosyltransferase [Armatimonadota bacterium]|nr:ATP phosphoribosyltransferase [Armatimonadota bacterium]MDR7456641.1 ATP phosphoribosyltransferase [Armatimonadota bacterium]MDR7495549.1 ATP phosphoribosyltransferase [Armatimonadota bacterium]MDR7510718.1 ATP phosphoribosyltransferase [Armatimonadota bacterium]